MLKYGWAHENPNGARAFVEIERDTFVPIQGGLTGEVMRNKMLTSPFVTLRERANLQRFFNAHGAARIVQRVARA